LQTLSKNRTFLQCYLPSVELFRLFCFVKKAVGENFLKKSLKVKKIIFIELFNKKTLERKFLLAAVEFFLLGTVINNWRHF